MDILRDEDFHDPAMANAHVTITEVRLSPDLRHAICFAESLGGAHAATVIDGLNRHAKYLRGKLGRSIEMKFTPDLKFVHDESFAAADRFAGIEVDTRWPDEAFAEWKPDGGTAVVTLTHDPKIDDPALVAALRSDAFYVAALGSRRTHKLRLERLSAMGFSEEELARIDGPAGLPIKAATPAEIALSILSGSIAALRGA